MDRHVLVLPATASAKIGSYVRSATADLSPANVEGVLTPRSDRKHKRIQNLTNSRKRLMKVPAGTVGHVTATLLDRLSRQQCW
jgi:hypothetical protein